MDCLPFQSHVPASGSAATDKFLHFSFVDLHALTLLVPHLDTLAMALRLFNKRTYLRLFQKFILLTHVCLRPHYVTPFAASIKQSNFLTVKCWVCTTDLCRSIPYLVIYPPFKRRLDRGLSCWHITTWKLGGRQQFHLQRKQVQKQVASVLCDM